MAERLYIVDGHGYIFRAHYGLMNISRGERREVRLSTSEGMPTGALYVFTRMLMRLEEDNAPKRMAVVFDDKSGKKTFRADLFPELPATVEGFKREIDNTDRILSKVTHNVSDGSFTTALELEIKATEILDE